MLKTSWFKKKEKKKVVSNPIDYVSIATEGTAVDFGDLSAAAAHHQGFSNGHGGLG